LKHLLVNRDGQVSLAATIVSWGLVALLVCAVFSFAFSELRYGWNWNAIWQYRQKFVQGWLITVAISAAALLVSLVIGLLTALARRSALLPLRYLSMLYVESVRGTPLLVLLTDGRGNVARNGQGGRAQAGEEALTCARLVRAAGVAAMVVDTSPHPHPQAKALAEAMDATYMPLPHADAGRLNAAVKAKAGL